MWMKHMALLKGGIIACIVYLVHCLHSKASNLCQQSSQPIPYFVLHLNLDECKLNKHYWLDRRGSLAVLAVVVCLSAGNIIASGKYAAGPYSFPTVNAFFWLQTLLVFWSRKYGSLNWITHLSACQNHKAGASYCMHNAPFYLQVPPSNACGSSSSSPNSLY